VYPTVYLSPQIPKDVSETVDMSGDLRDAKSKVYKQMLQKNQHKEDN